jgi:glucan phosphoethanolaminetransferase (alkaline phosphatase superfamily)
MMRPARNIVRSVTATLFTRETLAAFIFVALLIIFEMWVLNASLGPYFTKLAQREYAIGIGGLFLVCVSWAWTVLFVRTSLTSKYGMRIFCFLLFVAAVLIEYGYQNAFARFSIVEDLRIALFDASNEQRRGSILAYADWRALIPCLAYAILLVQSRARRQHSWKMTGLVIILLAGFYSTLSPYTSGQSPTLSLDAFLRTAILSPWKWASGYHGPREAINFHSEKQPQNNIIIVVDESVRGDHLRINGYYRDTTPYLDQLVAQGWLYNWGVAVSGGTCSEKSDSLLFTGMTLGELPDTTFQMRRRPNIFQYAKAMGYQTHFLDGQKDTFWLGTAYDKQYLDDWQTASALAGPDNFDIDAGIARRISAILNGSNGNFIWVIKRGVHYPYSTNFPAATNTEWQPSDADERRIDPASREQLTNTYDNALKYNLESFFRALNITGWSRRNLMVYTSDHGQTLSEHGERYTHCGTSIETSPTEANVPLFIVSREPLKVENSFRASHANIFATLLDLMSFPKSELRYQHAISLLDAKAADSQPRFFWVGDLNERAFNGRVLFDR